MRRIAVVLVFSALAGSCDGAGTSSGRRGISGALGAAMPLPRAPIGVGASAALAADRRAPPCPRGMLLVDGDYCPNPQQRCLRWLETKGRFGRTRCAEYDAPVICAAKQRRPMRFCIDRDEYVAPEATTPLTGRTLVQAERICRDAGKRLCGESEWTFACEGEAMSPYPYGFARDAEACNADKNPVVGADDQLVSMAAAPGSFPRCTSPFGVRDMTGNVEEWVRSETRPKRGVMKGAYWLPTRNNCRAGQRIHGPLYSGVELGFRCCADAPRGAG